jgi:hypothetical protein
LKDDINRSIVLAKGSLLSFRMSEFSVDKAQLDSLLTAKDPSKALETYGGLSQLAEALCTDLQQGITEPISSKRAETYEPKVLTIL